MLQSGHYFGAVSKSSHTIDSIFQQAIGNNGAMRMVRPYLSSPGQVDTVVLIALAPLPFVFLACARVGIVLESSIHRLVD